jgi:hypothetical protein
MSTITPNAILSTTKSQRYGQVWADVYDMLKPDIVQTLIPYYGKGVGLAEWAAMAGSTITFGSVSATVYEEGSPYKLVEVEIINVAAEGQDITVKLADAEYDANGKAYLSINDVIVIPAEYLEKPTGTKAIKPEMYQVVTVTPAGALNVETTYTCRPHLATVHLHKAVPSGTKLPVTGGLYANEATGGKSKSSGWYTRSFTNSTVRTDWSQGGSTQSNKRYYEELKGGGTGIYTKNTAEASMRHTKTISDQMWLGSGVTNTALTMANRDGDAIDVTGTVGVYQHLVDRAMPQYYNTAYDKPCFEDVKPALESQGIMNRSVFFVYGSELGRQVENMGLDFNKEFSGGANYLQSMGNIDATLKSATFNGVHFIFKELPSLSDPIGCGAAAFDDSFRSMGFIMPDVDVTIKESNDGVPISIKNLTLGYKSYNGEDRTRVVKVLPGAGDIGNSGNIAVDLWDDCRGSILSEFRVYANKFNQCILINDDRLLIPQ